MYKSAVFDTLKKAMVDGDENRARRGAQEALDLGIDPLVALEEGLSKGMTVVGDLFESGDAFLPELLMAAEAFDAAMAILKPELVAQRKELERTGTVVIATVKGDLHDIGKNIVAMILETRGLDVVDLGVDVPTLDIIEGAERARADVIALSCLMTTTMQSQREVLAALEELGVRNRYKVVVGGGPVTESWVDEIGADGYAPNAVGAVRLIKGLL
jgi:trimethylamine corrinoid protein